MPNMTAEDIKNVIPGESMTKPRGKLPFDKPARTSSPEAGIQLVFDAITEPKSARKLIKTLELGVPIDKIVGSLSMMLHGEGIISPQAIPLMVPAMASMIEGMAKLAGTKVSYTEEPDPWTTPDEERVEKLVSEMTGKIVDEAPQEEEMIEEPQGLMSPPVVEEEGII